MKNKCFITSVAAVAGAAMLVTGCVVHEHTVVPPPVVLDSGAPVYVATPPPPPQVDAVTVSPGPGYIWVGGAWYWDNRWVWRSGYWGRPPRPGAVWIGPRYIYHGGRRIWYRGYWR